MLNKLLISILLCTPLTASSLTITSGSADINLKNNDISFANRVMLEGQNLVINSKDAEYQHQRQVIKFKNDVHLQSGNNRANADSLTYNIASKAVTLKGDANNKVHATLEFTNPKSDGI